MQSLANIARFSLIAVVWFSAMLGFAIFFTFALQAPYDMLESSPLVQTLITMSLAILNASVIAGLSWQALRRRVTPRAAVVSESQQEAEAAFVRIG